MGIVRALLDWLQAPEQLGLRRAFAVWFGRVFLPKRLPGVELPPLRSKSRSTFAPSPSGRALG